MENRTPKPRDIERALDRGDEKSAALADRLAACGSRSPCGLAVCPRCHANWKVPVAEAAERLLARSEKVWLMTVILPDPDLRQGRLSKIEPKAAIQSMRMLLRRHGLGNRTAFGVLEADWHETDKVWERHFHLLIAGEKPDVASLKAGLRARRGEVYRPVQVKAVDDLPGAIGYVLKMSAKRKVRFRQDGMTRTYRYQLRGKKLRAALRWYARPPAHFLLLQGLSFSSESLKLLI